MPDAKTVAAFVSHVESGDYAGAIERWYRPDASMQENGDAPRVGRDTLAAGERQIMSAFKAIRAKQAGPALINGDQVVVRWRFEFEPHNGPAKVLEELAWQTWRGDLIAEETFFYDPKQMT